MASPHAESFYCISEENLSLDYRKIYTGTCIGCAAVGLAGSLTQVISLRKLWKSTPATSNRNPFMPNATVVFFLAVADMLACLAVITRSVTLAIIPPPKMSREGLYPASQLVVDIGAPIQSFLQFFFLATYFWTFFFALDIFLQLSKRSISNLSYHVFTWLAAGILTGFSEFIVFFDVGFPCADHTRVTLAHMATYIPIVGVMIANPIIYVLSYSKLKKLVRRQGVYGHSQRKLMRHVTRKFSAYVVIFWICWLPSIATGIYLQVKGVDVQFPFSLWMLTAILNPLQGFFNCFIYGIGSDMVASMQLADQQGRQPQYRAASLANAVNPPRSLSYSRPSLPPGTGSQVSGAASPPARSALSPSPGGTRDDQQRHSQNTTPFSFTSRSSERSPLLVPASMSSTSH